MALYIYAICYFHKVNGYQDTTKLFIINKLLEGLLRSAWVTKDTRIPISHELFSKIIHSLTHICNSVYESALFLAAFTLAYFGLLRVSETLALQCKHIKIKVNLLCQITLSNYNIKVQDGSNGVFFCCGHNTLRPLSAKLKPLKVI